MRPIRLVLENLRSYRERQEVDFSELGLFAITGSTGAGKSSLLEAMVYALYGCSTFDQRSVKPLIADGAPDATMTVALEFTAREGRWQVERSASRTGKHSVHCLRRLDPPESFEGPASFDSETEVNKQIEHLLGLDVDQFLRTVVLPQGRFQDLLLAKPSERGTLMKNLLGLDDLDRLAGVVEVRLKTLNELLTRAREQRKMLGEDPEGALAAARAALEQARQTEQAGRTGLDECRALQAEVDRLGQESAQWAQRRKICQALPADLELRLSSLQPVEADLNRRRSELSGALEQVATRLARAQKEVDERKQQGRQRPQLTEWLQCASSLQERAGELDRGRSELVPEEERLRELDTELERLEAARAQDEARKAEIVCQGQLARQEHLAAQQAAQAAGQWLMRVRAHLQQMEQTAQKLKRAGTDLETSRGQVEQLEQAFHRAEAEHLEARQAREQREREHQAAALAGSCRPEDPCPVCTRPLPADFVPPRAGDLDQVRKEELRLERAAGQARAQWQKVLGGLEQLQAARDGHEEERTRQTSSLEKLRQEGLELLGSPVDLDLFDELILAPLQERAEQTARCHEEQQGAYRTFDAECKARDRERADRQKAREELTARLERERRRLQELAARLEGWRVALRQAFGLGEEEPVDPGFARSQLNAELEDLDALERRHRQALEESNRLNGEKSGLEERRRKELEAPLRQVENQLRELKTALGGLGLELTGLDAPLPDLPDLESLRETSRRLQRARKQAEQHLSEQLERLGQALSEATDTLAGRLRELGAATTRELEERAATGAAGRALAEKQVEDAAARSQKARALDTVMAPALAREQALRYLHATLGNKTTKKSQPFAQWLLERRQQELLEIASTRLGEMTGGQFGFSQQFQMVDRHSGQVRKPETLSGGETFLASLSLALALSEQVGRKGGRLEAFFLDEGFGSLSPESLDRAMDALELLSQTGRMIGVISHVTSVAERLERVLRVTRTASGSRVEELGASERSQMAAAELAEAVTALTGS